MHSSDRSGQLAEQLLHGIRLVDDTLCLQITDCTIRIRSNSSNLLLGLKAYFRYYLVIQQARPDDIEIIAIEASPPELPYQFTDWKREPGKTGRKDACFDLQDGRLVRKVRTGMLFLQNRQHQLAIGPCCKNPNQVINFINAQYMNRLQHQNWLICHASAIVMNGTGLAISGLSGGGKSTLMLHLMEHEQTRFLTNDRLFIRQQDGKVWMTGIAKMPRINPGTLVNNPRLSTLLSAQDKMRYLDLPPERLWQLEEKYDVDIEQMYGKGRMAASATLNAYLVLNWRRDSHLPCSIKPVRLAQRPELLSAIMKSPGPFYDYPDGRFYSDTESLIQQPYQELLKQVSVFEASGKIDFALAANFCREQTARTSIGVQ